MPATASSPSRPPRLVRPSADALSAALVAVGLALGFFVLLAAPALGYVVVLKDGEQITTREAPRVDGERVILVLQNGTEAFYRASQVDFEKTREVNAGANLSNARVIDGFRGGGDVEQQQVEPERDETSLSDLVATRSLSLPDRARRPDRPTEDAEIDVPYTRAGFVDLQTMERKNFTSQAAAADIQRYLKSQGHDSVRVYQGSAPDRPFVELTAASEASVFKSLKDVANALVQMRDRHPDTVASFDVLMMTDDRIRAGQFSLTPALANLLVTGELEPPEFFVQHVEF